MHRNPPPKRKPKRNRLRGRKKPNPHRRRKRSLQRARKRNLRAARKRNRPLRRKPNQRKQRSRKHRQANLISREPETGSSSSASRGSHAYPKFLEGLLLTGS